MYNSYFKTDRIFFLLCIGIIILFFISLTTKSSFDDCQWKFDHYSPSPWELYWYNNITYLQNQVCSKLKENDQINKSIRSLEYIINLQRTIYNKSFLSNEYDELFSKMYYKYECSTSSQLDRIVSQYIEPLIGLLRDPLTICSYENLPSTLKISGSNEIQSKRFFLLGPSAPYDNFHMSTISIAPWLYQQNSQKILFDIGASLFNGVNDPNTVSSVIGARWFYEYFQLNSLSFDRIIAFEASQYSPRTYWQQIPDDIIGRLTFINVGVEKTGKFNPWNILKSIVKKTDYVIVKLDIDHSILENQLIEQILNDKSLSILIDEFFFEMHITVNEMKRFWGSPPGQLKDSYLLFTKLRQLGIRMHSWP
ncbi:unnamed protein product [Rotaria sp. Silwood1]|nr:unnamed protein product [Rotaria sp. Silwood1]CAF4933689.1 unnamed protein product [Rotaria sp. Silwood1]